MPCRKLYTNKLRIKQITGSLQAHHNMFPPAQHDTSSGRVSSCIFSSKGSLTVEAAFTVPLFFLAMIILLSFMDLIRVQSRITVSLNESAKILGMYYYAAEEAVGGAPMDVTAPRACILFAQSRLPAQRYTQVSLLDSSFRDHMIDLTAKVTYRFPVALGGIKRVSFWCHARVHAWTGYRYEEESGSSVSDPEMVYVTDRETVYHTFGDCSYLHVTVFCTTASDVELRRNEYGSRYTPCPFCKPDNSDLTLYITPRGDHYHGDAECLSLKRTGELVKKSDVSDLKECSRCAERRSK